MTDARFTGQVVIVTGAGSGIGRAVALGFAAEGAHVVVADLDGDRAAETARLALGGGGSAEARTVDLGRVEQVVAMVDDTVAQHGRLDVLHNNAGMNKASADLWQCTAEDWDGVLNVNLRAAFFAIQRAVPVMRDQGGGRILNTASISSFIASGRPVIPYDVAKAGLRHLTVTVAAHVAPFKITVNAIAPGLTRTSLSAAVMENPQALDIRVGLIPMGRPAVPEDMVGAVLFLASSDAAYITGQVIAIDGGRLTSPG